MKMPAVKTAEGYTHRLHPLSCPVSLSLQPLSTVNMTLPDSDTLGVCEWVEVETPDGIGYYRTQSVSTDALDGTQAVYLEHGACTLGDTQIPDGVTKKDTVENILSYILGQQDSGQDVTWGLGTVAAMDTIYVDIGGMSPMDAISTMMSSIPDYQAVYRQESATDWYVDIVARPQTPSCEGRMSRNIKSCDISYNAQGIVTRVYAQGLTGGYMDSPNISVYGLRTETQNLNEGLTTAQKEAIVQSYLRNHDHPTISISINAVELAQITGLAIDELRVGKLCRIVIPWLHITVEEVITEKRWSDLLEDAENVSITLANATPDLSIAIAAIASRGGGGMAGRVEKQDEAKKRFETKFEQSDEYFRLLATDTQWSELADGTVTAYSQIIQTASSIQSVVSRSGYTEGAFFSPSVNYAEDDIVIYDGKMYQFTAAHHGAWTGADVRQITNLYSSITQNESGIETLVAKTGINSLGQNETLYSKITQTATQISAKVDKTDVTITGDGVSITGIGTLDISGLKTRVGELEADYVSASGLASMTLSVASIEADSATIADVIIGPEGEISVTDVDLNGDSLTTLIGDLQDGISDAQVVPSGSDYVFQIKRYGDSNWTNKGTFRRAATPTITGAWGNGTFTVRADGTVVPAATTELYGVTLGTPTKGSISGMLNVPATVYYDDGEGNPVDTGLTGSTPTLNVSSLLTTATVAPGGTVTAGSGSYANYIGFTSVTANGEPTPVAPRDVRSLDVDSSRITYTPGSHVYALGADITYDDGDTGTSSMDVRVQMGNYTPDSGAGSYVINVAGNTSQTFVPTEAFNAGAATTGYQLATVTLQGNSVTAYKPDANGTTYYTPGSPVTYYQGETQKYTSATRYTRDSTAKYLVGTSVSRQRLGPMYIKSGNSYVQVGSDDSAWFRVDDRTLTTLYKLGEQRYITNGSETVLIPSGTGEYTIAGSPVTVTPISSTSIKVSQATLYEAGQTVSNTYYTRNAS